MSNTVTAKKPNKFLIAFACLVCFSLTALCPLVLVVQWTYFSQWFDPEKLAGKYSNYFNSLLTQSFWYVEAALALVSLLVIMRSNSPLYRYAAWSALAGCLAGMKFGVWLNEELWRDFPMVGPS